MRYTDNGMDRERPTDLEDGEGAVEPAQHQLLLPVPVHIPQQLCRVGGYWLRQGGRCCYWTTRTKRRRGGGGGGGSIGSTGSHAHTTQYCMASTYHGRRRVVRLEHQLLALQKGRRRRRRRRPALPTTSLRGRGRGTRRSARARGRLSWLRLPCARRARGRRRRHGLSACLLPPACVMGMVVLVVMLVR